jgi:phenylacetate-CoA ligase
MYSIFRPELHQSGLLYLDTLRKYLSGELAGQELASIRLKKLNEVIAYVRQGSPFYRQHLPAVHPTADRRTLSEIIEALPFTTKQDLSSAGISLCADALTGAWIYYETTGTTGTATPCPRNETDSLVNNSFLTLQYGPIFQDKKHVVGVMGPTEVHSTGDTFEDVFRSLGHTTVKMWPRSPLIGMERALRLIRDLKITALVCTPAVAAELLKFAKRKDVDPQRLGVENILVIGELITPNRLKNLTRNWNARIFNCMYASQEASILAACSDDNRLRTIPLNNYYELLCPFTGKVLNVGAEVVAGEMVITHLYKGNKPLLRYRTGDMVRCRAGKNESWTIEPIGRVKDVLILNDERVYAFDVENAIFEELDYCFEYSIEITRTGDRDHLAITLEKCDELNDAARLARLRDRLEGRFGVTVEIRAGDAGNLIGVGAMVSWKAARVHDRREADDNRQAGDNLERSAALEIMRGR